MSCIVNILWKSQDHMSLIWDYKMIVFKRKEQQFYLPPEDANKCSGFNSMVWCNSEH